MSVVHGRDTRLIQGQAFHPHGLIIGPNTWARVPDRGLAVGEPFRLSEDEVGRDVVLAVYPKERGFLEPLIYKKDGR
jgi:hypothetical protein